MNLFDVHTSCYARRKSFSRYERVFIIRNMISLPIKENVVLVLAGDLVSRLITSVVYRTSLRKAVFQVTRHRTQS